MKVTFIWKSPVLNDYSTADVKREIGKRLENLYLDWKFAPNPQSQRVSVYIYSAPHRDALRAIYRLSAPINNGVIQLINESVMIIY